MSSRTSWGDSHPSDRDRIENAAHEQAAGVFQLEHPASVLFTDINGLCKVVTLRLYRFLFEGTFDPRSVQATDQIVAVNETEQAEGSAALRFVLEQFCGYDTFLLPRYRLGAAVDSNLFKQNVNTRRARLLKDIRGYALIRKQEDQIAEERVKLICAQRLIEAGFNVSEQYQYFGVTSLQQVHVRIGQSEARNQQIQDQLKLFRKILGHRLLDALEFVRSTKMVDKIGEPPDVAAEVSRILGAWQSVITNNFLFEKLLFDTFVTVMMVQFAGHATDFQTQKAFVSAGERLHSHLSEVHMNTWQVHYPFVHGKGDISLAVFLLPDLPPRNDWTAILGAATELSENLDLFLRRCVARLGSIAEKVEQSYGFPPLETPAEIISQTDS